MYKLISRSINKSNKSLTKFTGIYKKISKNQQSYRTASKAYDGEDKEKPTERLVKRRSGTSFVGRAKITFKTLLFSKRSGGQAGKLSTKSFYSTGQKPKDGAPKKFFKDKFSYCLYKNAMEQCESIRKHSPSPGNSVGWNVKSATPQCIKEERHPTKRTVIPKPQIGTSRSVKPKILTEKYIIQKKVKQGFPATTVKVLNKTKIVYPIKKLQYTLSQQTKTGKDVKLEAEKYKIDKSKGRYTANKCNHTVEFIPRKIETVEQQLNNAAKKSLGKKGNSGDSGGQASRGESSGGRSAKIITNAPGNKAAGFTDPKFGAPSYQNQEKLPSIYGEHLHTKGNRISLHTHKVGSTSNLLVNKEERLLIQKHPTVRKATKYGKMDINKKYNILLKMHQKKIKLGHHVIKQNKKKDTLNEVATHSEVDQGKTSDAVEDPVDTAKDPIVSHPAVIQPAPRLNIDPIKYRRSVIVNKHKSYDIDDICLKSNDKSAHRISTNRNQSDNKLWQTVVLKEEPKMDERSNERVEQESPKRAVTPEKVKELIDNQTFLKKQDIAAQNLRDYVTKLQQLRDQTSIKAPSLVQEPPPQKLEKEESVKKVAVILQPGDLFPKKLIGNLDKKRWQASGNKDDVDVEKLQNISSQVSENISKKLRPAQQKRKGEISQFGKLMEHSNRELKRIRVKSGRNHGRTHESKTTKVHKSPRCLLEHYQPSEEVKKANVMKKLLDVYAVKVDDRKIAERSEKSNLKIKEILSRKDTQEKKKKVFMTDMKLVPTKISGSKKLQGDQNKMEVRHQQESDTSPKTDKKSYLPSDAVVSQNVDKKEKVAAEKPSIRINSQSTDDVKKDNVTNKSCLLSDYSKPVNKKYDAMDSAADMLRNKEHSSIRKSYRMSDTAPDMDKEEQGRLKSKSFVTSQNERDMLAVQSLTALNEKIKATEIHLILKAETSPQRPAQKKYYRENADSKKQVPADRPQFPEETSDAVREYRYRLNVQSLDQPENIDMTKTPGEYNKKQPSSIAARSSKTSTKIDPKKNFLLENYIPKSIEVSESDQTDTLTKTVILVNPTLKCLLDNTSFEMATKEEIGTLASEEGPRNVRSNKLDISYPKVTNEMNSSNREYTYLLSAEHHDTDQSTIRETKPLESAVTTKKDVEDCDRESEHGVENLHRRNSDRRNKYVPCTKNDNFTGLNKNSASELPDESASSYQANENQSDIRINPGCHSQKVSDIDSKVGNDDLIDQNVQLFYKKRNSDNVVVEEYEHKEKDIHRDVKLECKVPEQQNNNREEKITAASTDFGNLKPQDVSNLNETSKIRPRETQKVAEANQEIKKDRSVASKELDNLENDEVSSLNETSKIQQTLADVSMNIRHPHIPKEPPPPPPKNNGKKKEKPKGNKDVILPPPKSQPSNTKLAELMKDRYVNKKENEESRDKTVKVKTKSLKFKFVEPIDDKTEKSMKTDENGEVNNKVLIKHMNEDMKPTEPTEVKRIYESRLKTERKHPENTLIEDLDNKTVGKVHGNERIEGVFLCKNFIERNAIAIKDIQNMKTKTFSGKLKSSVKVHSLPDLKGEPTISRNMKSSYTVDDDKIFRCSSHIDKNIEAIKNNEGLRRRILGKRKVLKEEQTQLEEKEPENSIKPSEKVKNAPAKAFEKEFDTTKDKPRINFEYLRNDINRNKIEVVETFDKIRLKNIGEKEDHKNLREGDVMKKLPEVDYDKSGGNIKKKEAKSPTMRSRKSESSVKAPLMSAVEEKTNTNKKMEGACTAMDDEISLSSGNIQKNTETIKKNEELRRKIFGRRKVFKEEQGQLEEEPETGSKSPKNVKDKQTNEIEDINQKRNNGVSVVKFEKLYQKIISGQEDHPKLSEVDVSKKISEIDDEKSRSSREKMDNTKKETKSLIMKSTTFIRKDKSPAEAQMIADYEEESIISKKKKCSYTVDDDKIFLSNSHTGKDIETIKKNEELRRRILGRRNVFKEEQGQLEEEPEIGSKLSEKVKDKPAKVSEKDLDTSENTPRINVENLRNEIEGIDRKRKNALVVEKFEKLCQKIIGGQEDHSKLPEVEVSKKLLEVDYEKTRSIKENMDNTKKENNSMIMKSTTFDGKDKSPAEAQIISDYEDQSIISKKKKISYTVDDDKIFLSSSHTGKNIETIKKNKELRRRIFGRRKVFKEQVQLEEEPEIGSKSSEKVKDKPAKVSEKDRDTSENTRRINVENLRNEIEEIDKKRKNALVVEKFEKLRQKIIGGQEDHSKLLELSKKLPESRSSKEKLILKSTPSAIKDKSPAKAQIIANYEEESIISKKTKCSYTVDDDKTFLTSSHTGTNIETIKKNDELKRSMFGKRKVFKEEPEIGSKPSKKVEGEPTEASEKDRDISENTRRINTDNLRNEIQDINQNRKNAEVVDKFEKLRQRIICARGDLSKLPEVDVSKQLSEKIIGKKMETNPGTTSKNMLFTDKSSNATKRIALAKAWSSRDVKLINEENLKHEIAYRQFLRDINSKNRKKGDIFLASNTSKQDTKEIIEIYAAEKVRNTGKTREARNLVGGKEKTDPSKPQKKKIDSSKIVRKDAKLRSYSAPVKKRIQDTSPDMKSKNQYKNILDDKSDKGNKKTDKLDANHKKKHALSGSSMGIGVTREARNLVGDIDKTELSKPHEGNINFSRILQKDGKRSELAKAWSSRDVKLINEENLKHEIAYRQFLRDINSKNRKKGDISLAVSSNTSKQHAKEIIDIYAAEKVRNTGKTREARNLVGEKDKTDPSKPQKEKINSSKILRKDAKRRSYSAPVRKRTQDTSPDMKSKKQFKYILDDESDVKDKKEHELSGTSMDTGVKTEARKLVGDRDKTDTSKLQKEKTDSPKHTSNIQKKKSSNLFKETPKLAASLIKFNKSIINVKKSSPKINQKPKNDFRHSSLHATTNRSGSPLRSASPVKPSISTAQNKQQETKKTSINSSPETTKQPRKLRRVESASPIRKSPRKLKDTGSEKEKPHELKKYQNILEERKCDDCFSVGGKLAKDAKKEKTDGGHKASGGGKGSTALPSKKKSKLLVKITLQKVQIKKDSSEKCPSTPSIPVKGGKEQKKADNISIPTKAFSEASVTKEKSLATSVIPTFPTTKKMSCRLDDFVCADSFVKSKEEAKEHKASKDPQTELERLLKDPSSRTLSSKYLLKPNKPYAKSCRMNEYETPLSRLLKPESEQTDLKYTEKKTHLLTYESGKTGTHKQQIKSTDSDKQQITMMDAHEFKGTFVDQNQLEPKYQALLRETSPPPKPNPQEDDSKQKQAPEKLEPGKPTKKCIIKLSRSPYMPIINVEKPKITYRLIRRRTCRNRSRSTKGRMQKPKKEISNSIIATKTNKRVTPGKEMGENKQGYHEIYLRVIMEKYRVDEIRLKEDEFSVPKIDIEFLKRKIMKEKIRRAKEKKLQRFFEGPKSGNPAFESKTDYKINKTIKDLHNDIKRHRDARFDENLAGTAKSNEDKNIKSNTVIGKTEKSSKDELNKINLKDVHNDNNRHRDTRLGKNEDGISKSHKNKNIKSDAIESVVTINESCKDKNNNVKSSVEMNNLSNFNVQVKEPKSNNDGKQLSQNKAVATKITKNCLHSKYLLENQIKTNPAQWYGFRLTEPSDKKPLPVSHITKFKKSTSKYLLEAQVASHEKAKEVKNITLLPHGSKEPKEINSEKRTYATNVQTELESVSAGTINIDVNRLKCLRIVNSEDFIGKQISFKSEEANNDLKEILDIEQQQNNLKAPKKSNKYHLTSEATPKHYKCLLQTQASSYESANKQPLLELKANKLLAEITPSSLREKLQYKYLLQNQTSENSNTYKQPRNILSNNKYLLQNQGSSHEHSSTDKQASLEFGASSTILEEIPSSPRNLRAEKIQSKCLLENQESLYENSNTDKKASLELEATSIGESSPSSKYLLPEKLQYKYLLQNQARIHENSNTDKEASLEFKSGNNILGDIPSSSRHLLQEKLQYKYLLQNQASLHGNSNTDKKASLEFKLGNKILEEIHLNSEYLPQEKSQYKYLLQNQANFHENADMDEKSSLDIEESNDILGKVPLSSSYLLQKKSQYKYLLQNQARIHENSNTDKQASLEFESGNDISGDIPSISEYLLQEKSQYKYLLHNQAGLHENSNKDKQASMELEATSILKDSPSSSRYLQEESSKKPYLSQLTEKAASVFVENQILGELKETGENTNRISGKSRSKSVLPSPEKFERLVKRRADSNAGSDDRKSASTNTYILKKHSLSPRQGDLETSKYLLSQVDSDESVNCRSVGITRIDENPNNIHPDVTENNINKDGSSVEKTLESQSILEIYANSILKEPIRRTASEADCSTRKTDILDLKSAENPIFHQTVDLEIVKHSSSRLREQTPLKKLESETFDGNDKKETQTKETVLKKHKYLLKSKVSTPSQWRLPQISENKPLNTSVLNQPTGKSLRNYQYLLEPINTSIQENVVLTSVEPVEKSINFVEKEKMTSLHKLEESSKTSYKCQVAEHLDDTSPLIRSCEKDQSAGDNFDKVLKNEASIPKRKFSKEDETEKMTVSTSPVQFSKKENSTSKSKYLLQSVHKRKYVTHTSDKNLDKFKKSPVEPGKYEKHKDKKNIKITPTKVLEDDLRKYILDKNMSTIFENQPFSSEPSVKANVEKIYDKEETVKKFNKKLFERISDQSKKSNLGILDLGKVCSETIATKSNETMCGKKEPPKKVSSNVEITNRKKEISKSRTIVIEKRLPVSKKQPQNKSRNKQLSAFDAKMRVPPMSISKSLISQSVEATTLNLNSAEKVMCIQKEDSKSSVLDKYKHLKVTYVTMNRPSSKKNEDGSPTVQAFEEEDTMSQRPLAEVISKRYQLLKKLHEEFNELNGNKDSNFEKTSRRFNDIATKENLTVGDLGKTEFEPEKTICKINLSNKTKEHRSLKERQIDNRMQQESKFNMLDIVQQKIKKSEINHKKSDVRKESKTNMLHVEKKMNLKISELNKNEVQTVSKGQSGEGKTVKQISSAANRHNREKQIKAKIGTLDEKEIELEKEICKGNIKVKPDDHPTNIAEILIKRITEADMLKEDDEKQNRGQKK